MNILILLVSIIIFIVFLVILILIKIKKRNIESTLFGAESSISLKKNPKKVTPPLIIKKEDALKVMEALEKNKESVDNISFSKNQPTSDENNINKVEDNRKVKKSLIKKGMPKPTSLPETIVENEKESIDSSIKTTLKETKPAEVDANKIENKPANKPVEIGYIRFDNVDDFLGKINDPELKNMLQYLKEKNYDFIDRRILTRTFSVKENFLEYLKRELINFLKDSYENLKSRISGLRRKGEDVQNISLKLMSIPLKIKIFESSFSKKDFLNILELIQGVDEELKNYKI